MSIDSETRERIVVIGAGAWGTTLAALLAHRHRNVTLVTQTADQAEEIASLRENRRYLPGVAVPATVHVTHARQEDLELATVVLIVVPAQRVREACAALRGRLERSTLVISCAKGLELGSLLRMSQVVVDAAGALESQVCVLSGPNLAGEIARGLPASTVVACSDERSARRAQSILQSATLRVYTSDDVIGVELGGALKNVIAIGAGVADGMGLGQNAKAAFIARGLAEIMRVGVAAGANPLTFGGLSGLGDLIATCESPLSRNRSFGERLGRGASLAEASGATGHVIEGLTTAQAAVDLAARYGVDVPICAVVVRALRDQLSLSEAVGELMARDLRPELDRGTLR
jgi:glycerol-3-phosphate dehydrogenase (NAD(P)+)